MLVKTQKLVGCIIFTFSIFASLISWTLLRSATQNFKLARLDRGRVTDVEWDQLRSLRCSHKMKVINAALHVPCSPFGEADMAPRVLITGGAGFVGSSLIKALRGQGLSSLKVIDNLWRGRLSNLCDGDCMCDVDLAVDFCFADLTDIAQARALFSNVDVVYHLADVVAGIGFVFSNEPWVFNQNIRIDANVLHLVTESTTIRDYIYVGTACSFPLELQSSYHVVKLYENQTYPAHPESAYGWSKLMGEYHAELMLKSKGSISSKHNLNVGILRFHNLYGPRSQYEDEKMAQALPSLIRKAIRFPQEKYMIWGSGKQYRDFMFLDDAVSALLTMRNRGMNKGVIQVGTGVPTTISEAARIIQNLTLQCLGKKLALEFNQGRPEGDKGRVAALDRATTLMDWRPRISIREGLAKTYAWVLRDMLQKAKLEPWMLINRTVHESTACLEREALRSHGTEPRPKDLLPTWKTKVVSDVKKTVRLHANSCILPAGKTMKYRYYSDIDTAVLRDARVSFCGSKSTPACRRGQDIFYISPHSATLPNDLTRCLQRSKASDLPVAIFFNKVYQTGTVNSKVNSIKKYIGARLRFLFSWSPYSARLVNLSCHHVWIPFGVGPDFSNLKHKAQIYDFGFSGVCWGSKYPLRSEICKTFPALKEKGLRMRPGLTDPNNLKKLEFGPYFSDKAYKEEIAKSKTWMATMLLPGQIDLVVPRYFEIMSSNTTLLLYERCKNCGGMLRDGVDGVAFSSGVDFQQKVLYYSAAANEEQRLRIVRSAAERSFTHRWSSRASSLVDALVNSSA